MTLKAIKAPKDALGAAAAAKAVKATLNAVAKGAQADFKVTTRTWTHRPEFNIDASQEDRRIVGTDDKIFQFVDKGTRPHFIFPRRAKRLSWMGTNYGAKTTVGVIGSKRSTNDNTIVRTMKVFHPGTEARKFTIVIRDKWAKEMVTRMQAAIVAGITEHHKKIANMGSSQ